jgi:hypothetical protein
VRHTRLSVRKQPGASRCSQATGGFGAARRATAGISPTPTPALTSERTAGYSAAAVVSIVVLGAARVASSLFVVLP